MTPARATLAATILDYVRNPQADSLVLRIVGLGLAAGLVLMAAGLWLAGKAGI